MIYVFGSNLAGRHGGGAAKFAYENKGTIWGVGYGRSADSFAIPTKDWDIETLPLEEIESFVKGFLVYARTSQHLEFQITAIGCGLAGYTHSQIAPMFKGASDNCIFQEEWREFLGDKYEYWEFKV